MIECIQNAVRAISNIEDIFITQHEMNDPEYLKVVITGTDYCLYIRKGYDYKVVYHLKRLLETVLVSILNSKTESAVFEIIKKEIENIIFDSSQDFYDARFDEGKGFGFLYERMSYALVRDKKVVLNKGIDPFTIETSLLKLENSSEFTMPVKMGELYAVKTAYHKVIILDDMYINDYIKSVFKLRLLFLDKMYDTRRYVEKIKNVNLQLEETILLRTAEVIEKNKQLEEDKKKLDDLNRALLELNQKLDNASRTDPLTGLANRRDFQDKFEFARTNIFSNLKPFGLIIGDIDHFKEVNDLYGHECGDRVLIKAAQILKKNLRMNDIVARYGGEEFVMLLYDTDINGLRFITEKMREKIADEVFIYKGKEFHITMSFGAAVFGGCYKLDECFGIVDKYLYKAKEAGRNRVVYPD